jgi:hypothetical protein
MPTVHVLRPRPPFSVAQARAFLRRSPPTLGDRIVTGERVLGAARVMGQTIGFQVAGAGDVESPTLRCTLTHGGTGDGDIDSGRVGEALRQIGDWLGADLTVSHLTEIAERYGVHRGTSGHYLRIAG